MKKYLVLCDGASSPSASGGEEKVVLETEGATPTVRLEAAAFRNHLQPLGPRLIDLLRIAALVYAADTRCLRGRETDVFGDDWTRQFRFIVPVWDHQFWVQEAVGDGLAETLAFLTGDRFEFLFTQRKKRGTLQSQELFRFKDPIDPLPAVDQIVMFSGGADSLAAVIDSMSKGRHPMLVSHRSAATISARQKNLVALLQKRFAPWQFPHLSLWVNRQGTRSIEFSQRSRSFLFASIGAITANLLKVDDVLLSDNGVVSLNLPQSGQNVGTVLSRSTHPKYLRLVEGLLRMITDQATLTITNSLLLKTKKEVVEMIAGSGHPDLLQETVSCAHVEGKTKLKPHCGVCTQCIDRRFAAVAADLEKHDLPARYELDVFSDAISKGEHRAHIENYVRHARRLEELQDTDVFFSTFPQLLDCLTAGDDADARGKEFYDLLQRHQVGVNSVLEKLVRDAAPAIRRGGLKKDSLLALVAGGTIAEDERIRCVNRLRELLQKSLPAAFKTKAAANESVVQDAGQTAFIAAKETLTKEGPQLPFATISTKPDFSNTTTAAPRNALFLEFKFLKARARLNSAVTELTSRVVVYRDQGAWALFVVYDPLRCIVDDDAFCRDFERHEGIFVAIVR